MQETVELGKAFQAFTDLIQKLFRYVVYLDFVHVFLNGDL